MCQWPFINCYADKRGGDEIPILILSPLSLAIQSMHELMRTYGTALTSFFEFEDFLYFIWYYA